MADDDERKARAAPGELDSAEWPFWIEYQGYEKPGVDAAEEYRDRFPPARALAEVAFKRRLLAAADAAINGFTDFAETEREFARREMLEDLLDDLAAIYGGYPGAQPPSMTLSETGTPDA